jgi:23S rRNA (cytosine1962-C5)-methyltransferase
VSDALSNRLKKNLRRLRPWAEKNGVRAFRVYDRDLPEVPLALDLYDTVDDGAHLHASVFEPRHGIEAAKVNAWVAAAAAELGIPPDRTHTKRRAPGDSYEKKGESGRRFQVEEGGLRFWVNLDDYLDTGLFLDHRNTRAMVRDASQDKRVLNLFAYTGSFSVYAAAGGAKETMSVDLSPTYGRWAEDNLSLNVSEGRERHVVVVTDAMEWLEARAREGRARFDLAVIDPPTLSRSKRAASFDVQRDHERLISLAMAILSPGGVIFFSTNFQSFVLGRVNAAVVDEITSSTVPLDFTRKPPIHRAWRIQK